MICCGKREGRKVNFSKEEILHDDTKEITNQIFGEIKKNIREAIFRKHIDYGQLAELSGCNKSYLYKVIHYDTKPGLDILLKLCLVLDMSLDELIPPIIFDDRSEKERIMKEELKQIFGMLNEEETGTLLRMISMWMEVKKGDES